MRKNLSCLTSFKIQILECTCYFRCSFFRDVLKSRYWEKNCCSVDKIVSSLISFPVCEELRDGVVAVVDMTSPRDAQQLRWLSGAAGLAYISVVDDSYFRDSQEHERLHARVEPTAVQMLKIVTDIVIQENLNNVALVYDDTFGG